MAFKDLVILLLAQSLHEVTNNTYESLSDYVSQGHEVALPFMSENGGYFSVPCWI